MISRCGAEATTGNTGNVSPQEQVDMIMLDGRNADMFDSTGSVGFDEHVHDVLLGNSLAYIAGYIVRKLGTQLSCQTCLDSLFSSGSTRHEQLLTLLRLKDNGGLVYPADGVVDVILVATNYFKSSVKPRLIECTKVILEKFGSSDIFNLNQHILDSATGINNHYISLLRTITSAFFDLYMHHNAKRLTLQLQGQSVRQKYNKTTLFMGQ